MNPFTAARFAWEASAVFALRSLALWAEPASAPARLTDYALEKHRAFTAGTVDAGRAALRGADPVAIMAAAVAPARRRVRANRRALSRTG